MDYKVLLKIHKESFPLNKLTSESRTREQMLTPNTDSNAPPQRPTRCRVWHLREKRPVFSSVSSANVADIVNLT